MRSVCAFAAALLTLASVALADAPSIAIPPENRADQSAPGIFPNDAALDENASRLFGAVVSDNAESVKNFFFPRDAFLILKGIAAPGAYHDLLSRHYADDIHALHQSIANVAHAHFTRFEFSRRRTWQSVRSEANALPYWSVRHSKVHYEVDGRAQEFEIRTLINWGPHWYVTHLK